ncbi:MAG TPA: cell division protein SepF, partial [Verrucomicrobiae bacterium]|nr:cell division protein SepF [Verrucomicrobiae bacterium]
MAKKFMDRVLSMMGFEDDIVEEEEIVEEESPKEVERVEEGRSRRGGAQVISIHSQKQMKVVIMEPKSFDEAQSIADQLKNRRPVIVNLESA